jgi:hypothetical protein
MDLRAVYSYMEELGGEHSEALDNAESIAKLTLPGVAPRGTKIEDEPYTNEGTNAVLSRASSLDHGMFPPGATSFSYTLKESAKIAAEQEDQALLTELNTRLEKRRDDVASSLQRKAAKSRMIASFRRLLIEGSTLYVNHADRIDIYPLRDFVVERESGIPRIVICKQEITPDPLEITDQSPKNDKPVCTYTLFNFEKGEVWKQSDAWEGDAAKNAKRIDESEDPEERINIRQAVLAVGEVPDVGDYPVGYAHHHRRLIAMLNHIDSGLGEGVAIAAWNLLRARPGSPVAADPEGIKSKRSGDVIVADEGDLEWLGAAVKLGDFAFLVGLREVLKDVLAVAFAMQLSNRNYAGQPKSATEIIELVSDIHQQSQDLGSTLEETLHRPLIAAETYLFEQANPILKGMKISNDSPLAHPELLADILITSGANALEEQRRERQFILQEFPMLKTLDPMLQINGKKAADMFTARTRMQQNGLYYRLTPEQMVQQQLLAAGAVGGGAQNGGIQPAQPAQPGSPAPIMS